MKVLFHCEVITFKMILTRSKRISEEPLLTLSAAKKKEWMYNVGNSLDTKRNEDAPVTDAPVNFMEDVLWFSIEFDIINYKHPLISLIQYN